MDKKTPLYCLNERLSCGHYPVKSATRFIYREFDAGKAFTVDAAFHHLLVFMDGCCTVDCDRFTDRVFVADEMIVIPESADFSGRARERLRFIDMCFDTPVSCCDKMILKSYSQFRPKVRYDFRPMPVRRPLPEFCDMLAYSLGNNGMCCEHFHELKHLEMFFYIRGFYSKEEVAELLYPLVSRTVGFKDFIRRNHVRVSSLDELIALSNMSRRTFFRKFKSEFGMTVYRWMLKQRCGMIVSEFSRQGSTPKEVAERLGFDSAGNFCNFCKRNLGLTPTELMRKCRTGEVRPEDIGC